MALTITDACTGCDLCVDECPNSAIFTVGQTFHINPDRCTECVGHYDSPSCVGVCPVACIVADPARTESLAQLADKYAGLFG